MIDAHNGVSKFYSSNVTFYARKCLGSFFFYLCTIESKIVDRFVLLLLLLLLFVSAVFVVVNYFNLFNNCGNPFCRVSLHVLFHFDGKLNS